MDRKKTYHCAIFSIEKGPNFPFTTQLEANKKKKHVHKRLQKGENIRLAVDDPNKYPGESLESDTFSTILS